MLRSPIVLVGGTALAGWQIRAYSRDVDLYMPEISADAVEFVEQEFRARRGASFRLDVTTGENVWGQILIRDIASSPVLGTISDLELRVLRIEDLFLLKLASGRARDLPDLDLLAPRTTANALVDRWNQLIKWHGDRHAILGFADAWWSSCEGCLGGILWRPSHGSRSRPASARCCSIRIVARDRDERARGR